MRVLVVGTYYPEFLDELYRRNPMLEGRDYEAQLQLVFDRAFGVGDAYSHGLRKTGCEAVEVICNADGLQRRWALEHGVTPAGNIHDQRRAIVAAQIAHHRPDALLVFEWCPLGDAFLAEMKRNVRLVVGQISSPLPPNRTFAAYDLMLSSWPPIVEYFRGEGRSAEPLRLAFDERMLDRFKRAADFSPRGSAQAEACGSPEVTFVGGFAANHGERIAWLEAVLRHVDVAVFGYGVETTSADSPIRKHHQGPVWGTAMYAVLRGSRITLNHHARIDVRGQAATNVAANMRLYEATGVGTCLFTEAKDNLRDLFEPDREVVTYRHPAECVAKIRHYLSHPEERESIAQAGQSRTLREHTYTRRMHELAEILRRRIGSAVRSLWAIKPP